jgi:hypothetical protein
MALSCELPDVSRLKSCPFLSADIRQIIQYEDINQSLEFDDAEIRQLQVRGANIQEAFDAEEISPFFTGAGINWNNNPGGVTQKRNNTSASSKEELKAALKPGADEIMLTGEARDVWKKVKVVSTFGKVALGMLGLSAAVLVVGTVVMPPSAVITMPLATAVAAVTGAEIPVIILAGSVGLSLIIAVCKGYDEIDGPNGLRLRKHGTA